MHKILHTSDWHLGKKLFKRERHEEQELFLKNLREIIIREEIDILIIAGDIFDSPIPPTKSLSLFFEFLGQLEKEDNSLKHVFAIGGNHDNGPLLESPRPFLNPNFFKIVGTMDHDDFKNYCLRVDEHLFIGALPFFRPRDLFALEIENAPTFDSLQEDLLYRMEYWVGELRKTFKEGDKQKSILVGHHLFGSYYLSGSELGVGLSGLETLPLSLFKDWDLLALGHIHKPQTVKKEAPQAYYSGSPYPLRFSESNQKKYLIYKTTPDEIVATWHDFPIIRPLWRIKGKKEDLLRLALEKGNTGLLNPFLEITLTDDQLAPGQIEEIRKEFLEHNLEIINVYTMDATRVSFEDEKEDRALNDFTTEELFSLFLEEHDLKEKEKGNLKESFKELQQLVREDNALS